MTACLQKLLLVGIAVTAFTFSGCNNYGTKLMFNGGELFYTSKVTKDEANALGNYLVKGGFFDGVRKSVQLDKRDNVYLFRMVMKPEFVNDQKYIDLMKVFSKELSDEVFNKAAVEMHMCDDKLKTIKVVNP